MISNHEITSIPMVQRLPLRWLLIGYTLLFALFLLFFPFSDSIRSTFSNFFQALMPAAAAILAFLAAKSTKDHRIRRSWYCFALSGLLWSFAQIIWVYYGVFLGDEDPIVSAADIVWLVAFIPMVYGLLLYSPRSGKSSSEYTTILDSLLLTLAIFGLIWQLLLQHIFVHVTDLVPTLINIAYPICDLFVIFGVVSLMMRLPTGRVSNSLYYLVSAFSLLVIGDINYLFLMVDDLYQTGYPIDTLWVAGWMFIALAASSHLSSADKPDEKEPEAANSARKRVVLRLASDVWARILFPYLSLPSAVFVLWNEFFVHEDPNRIVSILTFVWAIGIVGLILLRQLLVALENNRLVQSLAQASETLEIRVNDRTKELTLLNQAVTRLSLCESSLQALDVGLQVALEATSLKRGVIWLFNPDTQPNCERLTEQTIDSRPTLAHTVGFDPEMEKIIAEDESIKRLVTQVPLSGSHVFTVSASFLERTDAQRQASPDGKSLVMPEWIISAPLRARGTIIGTLDLIGITGDCLLTETSVELVESIASELGIALDNARRYEEAKALADRDPVTALLNHRAFQEKLEVELKRASRNETELAVVMMDLDGFKLFNDTYGHPIGDSVLRTVALSLTENVRESDAIARYGGDEFAAILPTTSIEGALIVAERFRKAVLDRPFLAAPLDGSLSAALSRIPLRVSIGIAVYPRDGVLASELISGADFNLYESKRLGGDRITAHEANSTSDVPSSEGFSVLDGLITAVDNKDRYTRKHSDDVTVYSLELAEYLGLSESERRTLRIAGLLHDVGKIGVPDKVLRKPAALTSYEVAIVRQHVVLGEMIVGEMIAKDSSLVASANLPEVILAIGAHHERWDGTGYPRMLQGENIPLLGRILAVSDTFSAMTTDRPYRQGLSRSQALAEISRVAGSQLDPTLASGFVRMLADNRFEDTIEDPILDESFDAMSEISSEQKEEAVAV